MKCVRRVVGMVAEPLGEPLNRYRLTLGQEPVELERQPLFLEREAGKESNERCGRLLHLERRLVHTNHLRAPAAWQ